MPKPYSGSVPSSLKKHPCLELLTALWSSRDSNYQLGTLDRPTKRFRNIPVNSIGEAVHLAQKLSSEGSDTYFAIAGYETINNRTAANTSGAGGFWMDLDCGEDKAAKGKGYLTTQDAEEAVRKFCSAIGISPPTHAVDSGGGLHVYWVLDSFLPRDPWQGYAKKLKALTHAQGLLADDTRTADIASVLRLPGTHNYKYAPPRSVVIKHASDARIHVHSMLAAIDKAYKDLQGAAAGQRQTCNKQPASINTAFSNDACNKNTNWSVGRLAALVNVLNPEEGGRPWWIAVGMALHHVTGGSDEGLGLFDRFSKRGASYPGRSAIEGQWRSFNSDSANRHNIGTILNRVKAAGHDWMAICSEVDDPFEPCRCEAIEPKQLPLEEPCAMAVRTSSTNPLDSFSLRGMSDEIARDAQGEKPILGGLAILGQSTVIFAPPNSGKTLIILSSICEDIRQDKIEPSKVYYINVDDSAQGLANKLAIADEYGFHMLSEGYRGFNTSSLLTIMTEMIAGNQAKDVIVILDTIKKFTNLMDKTKASQFTKVIRRFVMKGATVIGMAHTNKKLGANGKPVYCGTSDTVDDSDCAYTIATEDCSNAFEKIVVFDNIKRRGSNPMRVAYRYSIESGMNYNELLMSVERVDGDQLAMAGQVAKSKSDAEVITSILDCINQGIDTKMKLAEATAKHSGISKRRALGIIEKYTGNDPVQHQWQFSVREHGRKVYVPLAKVTRQA